MDWGAVGEGLIFFLRFFPFLFLFCFDLVEGLGCITSVFVVVARPSLLFHPSFPSVSLSLTYRRPRARLGRGSFFFFFSRLLSIYLGEASSVCLGRGGGGENGSSSYYLLLLLWWCRWWWWRSVG